MDLLKEIGEIKHRLDNLQRLKGLLSQLPELKGRVNLNLSRLTFDKTLRIDQEDSSFAFELDTPEKLYFPWDDTNLLTSFCLVTKQFETEKVETLTNGKFLSRCKFACLGDKMLVCGGTIDEVLSSHAVLLDISTKTVKVMENMPYSSADFGLCKVGNSVLLAGGENSKRLSYSLCLREGKWNEMGRMNSDKSNPCLAVVNKHVYCFGGTIEEFGWVERFTKRESWEVLSVKVDKSCLRSMIGLIVKENTVKLVGGVDLNDEETEDVIDFNLEGNKVNRGKDAVLSYPTCFVNNFESLNETDCAFDVNGNVHCFGEEYTFYELPDRETIFGDYI